MDGYSHFFARAVRVGDDDLSWFIARSVGVDRRPWLPSDRRARWQVRQVGNRLGCVIRRQRRLWFHADLISGWRVGVSLIWLNIVGYRHRFGFRSIAVNHLRLAGLTVANFTGIRCFRPDYLGAIWQFNLAAILVLDYNGTWFQFIANRHGLTVLQVHRCSSFNRVLFGIGLLDH